MTIPPTAIAMANRVGHTLPFIVMGALLLYIIQPVPPRTPEFPLVHISAHQMQKLEPSAKPSTLSKIARPVAKLQERVLADGAGRQMLNAFVDAAIASNDSSANVDQPDSLMDDTARIVHNPIPPRLAYVYAWDYTRSHLNLFTFTSDGAKERLAYNVCGHVTGRMVGDSAISQGSRACWLPGLSLVAGVGGVTYGLVKRDPLVAGVSLLELLVRRQMLSRSR